jgi:hypothetical protein
MTSAIKGVAPIRASNFDDQTMRDDEVHNPQNEKQNAAGKCDVSSRDLIDRLLDVFWLMPF